MSGGYMRVSVDAWQDEEHYAREWSPENPAPPRWARSDIAWYLETRRAIPSARDAAAAWGWARNRAARLIREELEQQAAWEQRKDGKTAILKILAEWAAKAPKREPKRPDDQSSGTGAGQHPASMQDASGTPDHVDTPAIDDEAGRERDVSGTGAGREWDIRASVFLDLPSASASASAKTPLPPAGGSTPPREPPEPEPEPPPTPPDTLPAWVPPARDCRPHTRETVAEMVLTAIAAITGKPPNPHAAGTSAKPILALWRALSRPPPADLAADLVLVAEWAHRAPDRLAARDIRAEGWEGGVDRRHHVTTLCVQKSWDARLNAAKAWRDAGKPTASATGPPAWDWGDPLDDEPTTTKAAK